MTEYPFGRQPDKTTFPVRNRIVSGISQGVVVVEADVASGAMITANQAMEQGRTVFAVPGRVDSAGSRGPHKLIKQGARLVETVDDILEELQTLLPMPATPRQEQVRKVSLSEAENDILGLLEADGEADVDTLIRKSGRRAAEISALVMGLEIKRMVKMLPGQRVGLRRQ
jgi:DNA processing protein